MGIGLAHSYCTHLLLQSIMQESHDVTLNFGEEDELDRQKKLK
jgi:hypothetical protein